MNMTKDNLVEQFRTSGLTQKAFCALHNIELERLHYHLYKKNKRAPKKSAPEKNTSPSFISFNSPTTAVNHTGPISTINSVTIVHGSFSVRQLAHLITELHSVC